MRLLNAARGEKAAWTGAEDRYFPRRAPRHRRIRCQQSSSALAVGQIIWREARYPRCRSYCGIIVVLEFVPRTHPLTLRILPKPLSLLVAAGRNVQKHLESHPCRAYQQLYRTKNSRRKSLTKVPRGFHVSRHCETCGFRYTVKAVHMLFLIIPRHGFIADRNISLQKFLLHII